MESEELFTTQELQHESEAITETEPDNSDILNEVLMSEDLDSNKDDETEEIPETEEPADDTEDVENEEEEEVLEEESEMIPEETEQDENTEPTEATDGSEAAKKKPAAKINPNRITELPLAKVKHIIKLDPEVKLVNSEAVFLVTKAAEFFARSLAKESYTFATQQKKKTLTKAHVDHALTMLPIEL